MHLRSVELHQEEYPTREYYPFCLPVFHETRRVDFDTPVTLFVGENGTGKSTLVEALAHKSHIPIWRDEERRRFEYNPYEDKFCDYLSIEWTNGPVPGSFFGSSVFQEFARILDEWGAADPGQLRYFGGKSLMTQSHGQSFMSYFRARYRIEGLYLLDEPETALSPRSQIRMLQVLKEMSQAGHAQFIIASHSPILLALPGATIYSFDRTPISPVDYEQTACFRIYRDFLNSRQSFLDQAADTGL